MRAALFASLTLCLVVCVAPLARAIERPQHSVTRATAPIRLDGVLDEADWARAPAITEFLLIDVREGEAPVESTAVRVLLDDTHLHFGIRCENRHGGKVRASLAPRDQVVDQDQISIHLDTYRDFHRAFIFGINPYGVQLDGVLVGGKPDFNWDAVWDAEATRDSTGWTAEMSIPLRSLRFPSGSDGRWGLWVRRQVTKADEVSSWPLYRVAERGDIMLQAGDLTGLGAVRGSGALEAQPYVASVRTDTRGADPLEDSFGPWAGETETQVGLDLRYAITPTLSAAATINPDYSQIEADALQINVNQRFPLFFAEKRPFFLEGAEIFLMPINLVYTRRIANPDVGAKMIGTLGKLRMGAIAVRDGGGASLEGVGGVPIEGAARPGYFGIGRATLDFGENNSLGVLLTAHASDRTEGRITPAVVSPGAEEDGGNNLTASFDSNIRLASRLFFVAQLAASGTRVDSANTASWAPPGRGVFSGVAYSAAVRFEDGIRKVELYQDFVDPEFRTETGFIERVDMRRWGVASNFIARPENRWLRSWRPVLDGSVIHDRAGALQEWRVAPQVKLKFQNQMGLDMKLERIRERWLSRLFDRNEATLEFWDSHWQPLDWEFTFRMGDGIFYAPTDSASFLGWQEKMGLVATARPSPRLTSGVEVVRSRFSRGAGGEEIYDAWALGARTTWQFTRRLYARVFPQYDTEARHLDLDGLVGYVVHPGTVLYLGVNNGIDRLAGRVIPTSRTLFFKASYLFQR